jgi:hypothetical protein
MSLLLLSQNPLDRENLVSAGSIPPVPRHFQASAGPLPKPGLATAIASAILTVAAATSALPATYHQCDTAQQVGPILAALPAPEAAGLARVAEPSQPSKYRQSDVSQQVAPTLAALPAPAGFELARIAERAQPQDYAVTDFAAPSAVVIAQAPATIASWQSTDGRVAVLLRYEQGYVISQVKPTLAALPAPAGFELARIAEKIQPLRYAPSDVVAQVRPTLATLPTFAELTLTSSAAQPPRFSFDNVAQPVIAVFPAAPVTLNNWLSTDARLAVRYIYSYPESFTAPPKFALIVPAPLTVAQWLATDGQKAVKFTFARGDFNAPDKVLPTVGIAINARIDQSYVRLGGTSPVPKHFIASVRQILPAPAVVLGPTLASWLTNDARPSLVIDYSFSDIAAPAQPSAISALPTSSTFVVDTQPSAQPLKYERPTVSAPEKPLPTPIPFSFAWRSEDPYVPKFDWYVMADTLTGPAFVAAVKQAYASAPPAQPALANRYETLSTIFATPVRPLIVAALPTVSSWAPTEGAKAVQLNYAPSDWAAPAKFALIIIVQPTVASWTSTTGAKAVLLSYAPSDILTMQVQPTLALPPRAVALAEPVPNAQPPRFSRGDDFSAPIRFGIIVVPPTIASWTSTIGQAAVILRYARPDYVNQIQPTLAALPVMVAAAEPAPKAQPQPFTRGDDFSAPSKFALIVPTTPTVSSWMPTIGSPALPSLYAPTDFAAQVAPTLATLPLTLTGIAEPPSQAVKYSFAPGDTFSAPVQSFPTTGPFVFCAKFGVIQTLVAKGGFTAISSLVVTEFTIVCVD